MSGQANHDPTPETSSTTATPGASGKDSAKEVWGFKCAAEASALLNCAANGGTKKSYNEIKCQNLLKALRECCVREVSCSRHELAQ